MTTTTSIEELGRRIEQVVKEHLAASQAAVTAAVQRAFGAPPPDVPAKRRPHKTMKTAGRRTPQQLAEMEDRLYHAVCADPGRGVLDLAAAMGVAPRELHRPMTALRREGRVRSAGQRNHTRYFPTVQGTRASA